MSICGWNHQDPCIIVSIGDVEAVSNGPAYGYGLLAPVDGWEGGAPGKAGPIEFEQADGGVGGDVYYGQRTLIIEGDINAHDHEDLADKIAALSSLGRREILTVDESVHSGLVRQMEVSRLRPAQISTHGTEYATWTMTLQTTDWCRVDVDQQSTVIGTGGSVLRNIGDATAYLTLDMVGPLTNPGITWPGGAWEYRSSIPVGTTLTALMRSRVVRDPATSGRSRRHASGDWPTVPPGDTTFTRTGTGTGSITARWRSTWL